MEGSTGLRSGRQLKLNYGPSLERLAAGDRVGVKRTAEGAMKILINGDYAGVACSGVAAAARAMVSLAGRVMGVSVTSSHKVTSPGPGQEKSQASHLADSLHSTVLEKEAGRASSQRTPWPPPCSSSTTTRAATWRCVTATPWPGATTATTRAW